MKEQPSHIFDSRRSFLRTGAVSTISAALMMFRWDTGVTTGEQQQFIGDQFRNFEALGIPSAGELYATRVQFESTWHTSFTHHRQLYAGLRDIAAGTPHTEAALYARTGWSSFQENFYQPEPVWLNQHPIRQAHLQLVFNRVIQKLFWTTTAVST